MNLGCLVIIEGNTIAAVDLKISRACLGFEVQGTGHGANGGLEGDVNNWKPGV